MKYKCIANSTIYYLNYFYENTRKIEVASLYI